MSWKIVIHFKDGGTHDVGDIDSLEGAIEKIKKIFEEGLKIQTETRYAYYPPDELKMGETLKTE